MGNQVATPESGGNVPSVNLTGTGATASTNTTRTAAAPGAPIQYTLSIKTGNIDDAGTNANVYVILIGENGSESGLLRLPVKDVQGKKYFQKGQTDVISVTGPDVGEVRKVRVGHDNKGFGAGWFLDSITVKSPKMNDETNFVCRRWLDKKQDDGQIIREIIASKSSSGKSSLASYKITVKTGDVAGAGTDANVFICIFGDKGDTGNRVLTSQKNAFERNQVDIFNIEAEDVGVLKKIRIGHDNKGIGASWFLESVTITNEKRGTWTFPCNKWFDKEHDDKQLVRDVYTDEQQATATETMYTITVVTGNLRGAGTSSKVSVNIFGEKGETGDRSLENARDNFARGKTDSFEISAMELGDLRKLRIGVLGQTGYWTVSHSNQAITNREKELKSEMKELEKNGVFHVANG